VNLPFRVIPVVREVGSSKVEMQISLRSLYGGKITANSVNVKIPTPPNTALAKIHTAHGKAKYRPQHNAILWRFVRLCVWLIDCVPVQTVRLGVALGSVSLCK
jgi:AP-2 complex subunit mu-1